jgi:hypothetical protein
MKFLWCCVLIAVVVGISGSPVGDTPVGSLGGGALFGTGEDTSTGCGSPSRGPGGNGGSEAGSGTDESDIRRGEPIAPPAFRAS